MGSLLTITKIVADQAGCLICTCSVTQSDGSIDHEQIYALVPGDPMRGSLGNEVADWLVQHDGEYTIEPYTPPAPAPYRISKSTPWLRMTDEEAELITGAMQQAPSRQKGIYDAATYLSSDDPLWGSLHDMIATTLDSASRADELLAPET